MPMLWYGTGDYRVEPSAFEQLDKDSDRAVGLVAASIVEQRLEEMIKFWLADDDDIRGKLFKVSGPLGPLSVKIDLAYLMGIVSKAGHNDLVIMKGIRNDFAHKLEVDSFKIKSIANRCENLRLADVHIAEPKSSAVLSKGTFVQEKDGRPFILGYRGVADELKDARKRYILTAQLLSYFLGRAVDRQDRVKPYF